MDDIHGTHGTARIVKDPFLLLAQVLAIELLVQLRNNIIHHRARVIAVRTDRPLREVVQVRRVKDVEGFQVPVEIGEERRHQGQDDRENGEATEREALAFAARTRRGLFGTHGGYCLAGKLGFPMQEGQTAKEERKWEAEEVDDDLVFRTVEAPDSHRTPRNPGGKKHCEPWMLNRVLVRAWLQVVELLATGRTWEDAAGSGLQDACLLGVGSSCYGYPSLIINSPEQRGAQRSTESENM